MPKAVKGNAGRKPPEPSADHSDIDDWLRRLMPDLQPIVSGWTSRSERQSLAFATPSSGSGRTTDYQITAGSFEIAAYDVSVNVVFLGGADLDPPPPLGSTDRTRNAKVTSLEEAQRPELKKWIEQAGRTPGWK